MKKVAHPMYADYPEQPYISPERDLKAWERNPESFPYSKVARKQMVRLDEEVLPGDIIMLWRIHFGTFTTKSMIPQYFEYKYGVDSDESLATLLRLGYAEKCSATDSLPSLTVRELKRILAQNGLEVTGKKGDLLKRVTANIPEAKLAEQFSLRDYRITPVGTKLLEEYDSIIQQHGPKM